MATVIQPPLNYNTRLSGEPAKLNAETLWLLQVDALVVPPGTQPSPNGTIRAVIDQGHGRLIHSPNGVAEIGICQTARRSNVVSQQEDQVVERTQHPSVARGSEHHPVMDRRIRQREPLVRQRGPQVAQKEPPKITILLLHHTWNHEREQRCNISEYKALAAVDENEVPVPLHKGRRRSTTSTRVSRLDFQLSEKPFGSPNKHPCPPSTQDVIEIAAFLTSFQARQVNFTFFDAILAQVKISFFSVYFQELFSHL
jgi:hypothetical protein